MFASVSLADNTQPDQYHLQGKAKQSGEKTSILQTNQDPDFFRVTIGGLVHAPNKERNTKQQNRRDDD